MFLHKQARTIVDALDHYAHTQADALAYTFLVDGETQKRTLSYQQLQQQAQCIAQFLRQHNLQGRGVVLLFPSGLDFILAFFACAYAGAVAIPANLARNRQHYARLQGIIKHAQAAAVLTTDTLHASISQNLQNLAQDTHIAINSDITVFTIDQALAADTDMSKDETHELRPQADQLAFLQYTSGSTGEPKGVMIEHQQLIHNHRAIQQAAHLPEYTIVANWLPQFHDMGLIGGMLQSVALGGHSIFMSPLHFLQKPLRWLQMIHDYRAQATAAPNFALDLCVKAYKQHSANAHQSSFNIDISSLISLFCGSEPVHAHSVRAFVDTFAPFGLSSDALQPCYGMAESTLMISGGRVTARMKTLTVERAALANNRIQTMDASATHTQDVVCCGQVIAHHDTKIVDTNTLEVLPDGGVGEIWFAGPSTSRGYWRSDLNDAIFGAHTACGQGPYLRTGDLGFLYQGGLFITGRLKDMMIFRGRNIYPNDVEASIIQASAPFAEVHAAVFSTQDDASMVAYIELPRHFKAFAQDMDFKHMLMHIRQLVQQTYDVFLSDICFLTHHQIPRTSSGKIQRRECARLYATQAIQSTSACLFSTHASFHAMVHV